LLPGLVKVMQQVVMGLATQQGYCWGWAKLAGTAEQQLRWQMPVQH
jgi:hypothetical protein